MSNKERIIELLDNIPDYKIGYVLAYVQGVAADEEADDLFVKEWLKITKTHQMRTKKIYRLKIA